LTFYKHTSKFKRFKNIHQLLFVIKKYYLLQNQVNKKKCKRRLDIIRVNIDTTKKSNRLKNMLRYIKGVFVYKSVNIYIQQLVYKQTKSSISPSF
jgi:hypothetical protein